MMIARAAKPLSARALPAASVERGRRIEGLDASRAEPAARMRRK